MGRDSVRSRQPALRDPTAEEIAAYLSAHPDALADLISGNPELLERIAPQARRADGVIDLQAYMVQRLRREVEKLKEQRRAIVSATRANQSSQSRVHTAILFLLDAGEFEQLIHTITTDLAVLLDVDVVCLLVESNGHDLPHVHSSGVRVIGPGAIGRWLGPSDVLLEGNIRGDEDLFGPGAGLVRSQALVKLNVSSETPPALLALGSREADMFQAGMRTELMAFLARVLERCIRSWLELPK